MSVRSTRASSRTTPRGARKTLRVAAPHVQDQGEMDRHWMREAIAEGALGLGLTSPNPAVGCILVKGGREIARGHYRGSAGPHAEAVALAAAGGCARGATAYVTLEPHAHHGRTPPCTDALIGAGVARVQVGCIDPHHVVAGRGVRQLRRAGIEVRSGVLERECEELIRGYRRFITGQGPFVHLKLASTLDGRIAAAGGDSKWITTPASRAIVQTMRARAEAVLVGIGTVLADDPRLTCRIPGRLAGASRSLRVILDPQLRTPVGAKVLRGRGSALVVGSPDAPDSRRRRLERAGACVVRMDSRGAAGWRRLLRLLADRGVMELLVEGGSSVAASVVRAGVVNRVSIFYNPRLMGADGVAMVGPLDVRRAASARSLRTLDVRRIGEDLLWEGEFR